MGFGATMNRRVLMLALVVGWGTLEAQAPGTLPAERLPARVALSLAEALSRARVNSPTYRQVLNDAGPARWAVRNAFGQLVPRLDVGGSLGYVGSGQSQFGGSLFNQVSPSLTSGYGVELGMTLNGTVLTGLATQRANQRAVEADITAAARTLDNDVTFQYLTTLQAAAQAAVAQQQVERNRTFLELARARFEVGQGTLLDVRQAEVTLGQSEVELLRARQAESEAKLELLRRMGTELPIPVSELVLSDSFPVTEPRFDLPQLLRLAEEENPTLRASRAREQAADWSVRAAKSEYLPSLSLSAAWNGFTQEFTDQQLLVDQATSRAIQNAANCTFQNDLIRQLPGGGVPGYPNGGIVPDCREFAGLDATGLALLPENRSALLTRNNVWPFSFTGQPFRASVLVSVPIFTGFSQSLNVSRANAQREDAEELVRANRLQVRASVQARYLGVQTAYQAIGVQEANQRAAREQLDLARERFRLGNGSALEVADAQAAVARAEADYVNAVYSYHQAIAALEFAVGRSLR
jgi:outer membrane protein TolC